jgi:hypothetical protein
MMGIENVEAEYSTFSCAINHSQYIAIKRNYLNLNASLNYHRSMQKMRFIAIRLVAKKFLVYGIFPLRTVIS